MADSKQVVYDGFKRALAKGAPRDAGGILVDEQFGAAILRDARSQGFITCAPAERSGQEEFAFEYGDRWREHIAAFAPTFVKVLVRYNPESDAAMNRRQAARLKELSDYCHRSGHRFMFELLVPMTHEQSDRLEGDHRHYDRELRPSLMIGFLGGWTTYSTLAVDAVLVGKQGDVATGLAYLVATVFGGLALVVAGHGAGRNLVQRRLARV